MLLFCAGEQVRTANFLKIILARFHRRSKIEDEDMEEELLELSPNLGIMSNSAKLLERFQGWTITTHRPLTRRSPAPGLGLTKASL